MAQDCVLWPAAMESVCMVASQDVRTQESRTQESGLGSGNGYIRVTSGRLCAKTVPDVVAQMLLVSDDRGTGTLWASSRVGEFRWMSRPLQG
ncbi:hypothetical protein VM1G_11366 [Cytospora mali]|uniref:Uncharacterized protein n=1 Tax=Cytospora mali TaxID=578113 RepID=A0A194VR08_CYTMA|nr:hypothetical protein VM1G_11366 [Valsa mali]